MLSMKIEGNQILEGTVRIGGAKNSAVALIPASLLSDGIVSIDNIPNISDIDALNEILEYLGARVSKNDNTITIDSSTIINKEIPIPLVLHGGSGIPEDKIKKAIACGISKINVNTELQFTWSKALREFVGNDKEAIDPRKLIGSGEKPMKKRIEEIVTLFGTK